MLNNIICIYNVIYAYKFKQYLNDAIIYSTLAISQ